MARSPNIDKAFQMYKDGMKLVEIASQLGVPDGTVRRWKSTYKWDSEQSERSVKNERKKSERSVKHKESCNEVVDVINNDGLSDKQKQFCLLYVKSRNKVKAYQKAYGCSYENACSHGSTLWKKAEIQKEINRLLDEYRSNIDIEIRDLFQWHLDIARADIKDFMEWGQEEVPVMAMYGPVKVKDDETGESRDLTKKINVVKFLRSDEVDGTIISEVKQGKDGASIKLPDKLKAMQWLSEHIDLANEKQRAEIDLLKSKSKGSSNSSEEIFKNMETLAELIRKPVEDRNIDDLEGEPDE